jgi:hypothetical protein
MSECKELMDRMDNNPENIRLKFVSVYDWRKEARHYSEVLLDFKRKLLIGEGKTCEIMPIPRINLITLVRPDTKELKGIEPPPADFFEDYEDEHFEEAKS